jgi:hypothetical protein
VFAVGSVISSATSSGTQTLNQKGVNCMSRKRKISVGIVIALVTVLTGTALALSSISFNIGTIASYDFGGFGPGFPVPGTMQIQTFTLKPGETIPWHFHKGVSYVILSRGTLTEQHLVAPAQCASEELTAGSASSSPPVRCTALLTLDKMSP